MWNCRTVSGRAAAILGLVLAVFGLSVLLASCASVPPEEQARNQKIGVLLLHGKQGKPSDGAIATLNQVLRSNGYMVSAPGFAWGSSRYIDLGIEQTYDEITECIKELRAKGATKVVLIGQSMGTNIALSYGVHRGGIQGLIMVSPGHVPESRGSREHNQDSLQLARKMVAEGRGEEKATFTDGAQGDFFSVHMKARIYLDFFAPNSKAAMSKVAFKLDKNIPVLYVVGTQDKMSQRGRGFIFDKFPENPKNRYLVVQADHYGASFAAKDEILTWLKGI